MFWYFVFRGYSRSFLFSLSKNLPVSSVRLQKWNRIITEKNIQKFVQPKSSGCACVCVSWILHTSEENRKLSLMPLEEVKTIMCRRSWRNRRWSMVRAMVNGKNKQNIKLSNQTRNGMAVILIVQIWQLKPWRNTFWTNYIEHICSEPGQGMISGKKIQIINHEVDCERRRLLPNQTKPSNHTAHRHTQTGNDQAHGTIFFFKNYPNIIWQ